MGWILFRSLDRAWKEEMRSFTRRVTLVTLSATQVLIWAATAGVARPRPPPGRTGRTCRWPRRSGRGPCRGRPGPGWRPRPGPRRCPRPGTTGTPGCRLALGAPGVGGPDPGHGALGPRALADGLRQVRDPHPDPYPTRTTTNPAATPPTSSRSRPTTTIGHSMITGHRGHPDHATPTAPECAPPEPAGPPSPPLSPRSPRGRSAERPRAAHRAIPDFFRRPFFRQPEAAPGRVVPSRLLIERAASDRLRPWSADRPGAAPACAGCRRRPPNRRCRPADR